MLENNMKNRYGDEYTFEKVDENVYTIVGELKYWRYGGREGQEQMDLNDLGFVDPSGGPYIALGMNIEGRKVNRIRSEGEKLFFDVE
jgi:hypothetical protein